MIVQFYVLVWNRYTVLHTHELALGDMNIMVYSISNTVSRGEDLHVGLHNMK